MRQADKNRVARALEHVEAAITNLESMKWENLTDKESYDRQQAVRLLNEGKMFLSVWRMQNEKEE